jgi:hypothetical protein
MPGGTWFYNNGTNANTHLRPSSVTCGDTFSQREKALGLHRTKGFSLWEKLAAQRTDEGAAQCRNIAKTDANTQKGPADGWSFSILYSCCSMSLA